jgi:hypothetical protein
LAVFAGDNAVDWAAGGVMGMDGIAGGVLGTQLASSVVAKQWVIRLLVIVIVGALIHLSIHYVFQTV